jgi:hypothetical protein
MTNDERMTKREKLALPDALAVRWRSRSLWGAHAPSRADFGALAETFLWSTSAAGGKVCDHEGVIASTRGACVPP